MDADRRGEHAKIFPRGPRSAPEGVFLTYASNDGFTNRSRAGENPNQEHKQMYPVIPIDTAAYATQFVAAVFTIVTALVSLLFTTRG